MRSCPAHLTWCCAAIEPPYWCRAAVWHGHDCRKGQKRPATNAEFWNNKLDGNIARDATNQAKLRDLGWQVAIVWECQLRDDTAGLLTHLQGLRDGLAESDPILPPASNLPPNNIDTPDDFVRIDSMLIAFFVPCANTRHAGFMRDNCRMIE